MNVHFLLWFLKYLYYCGLLDGRKKKSTQVCQKSVVHLYTKLCELVKALAELLTIQVLTDTSILQLSSTGVAPFFAENVSELQLSCLKLVTTVSNYLSIDYDYYIDN